MRSTTGMENSNPSPLTAWVDGCNRIHPLIEQAISDHCLSNGTLDDLAGAAGIPLVCTTRPVVVITPLPRTRLIRYHVANPQSRSPRPTSPAGAEFEGGEHTAIGNSILLYFHRADPGTLAARVPLTLPNGLRLTYGEIAALGGDFYGIPDAPISGGGTPAERMMRFTDAYSTLAINAGAVAEARQILDVMQIEIRAVNDALAAGQPASSAYLALGDELSARWNRITGGGSLISPWIPLGRYLQLALANWDHLGQQAIDSYVAGHTVAMQSAREAKTAGISEQQRLLERSYAMNAFADHFLSDVFSAGHVRVPRSLCGTGRPSLMCCDVLRYMHDEDSHWGLNLENRTGSVRWHAYGDKRHFDTVNLANKNLVSAAVQRSVNEVFNAFNSGDIMPVPNMGALETTPTPLGSDRDPNNEQSAGNISPLFALRNSEALRRSDLNDLNDYSWTNNWSVPSTLWLLRNRYLPSPPQHYLQPPATAPDVDPHGWQVSHAVPPNWVMGSQVRYAVSFVSQLYESEPGVWCNYVTVMDQAYPTLTGVPLGPAATRSRKIYRQFENGAYTYVGELPNNTATTFVDSLP